MDIEEQYKFKECLRTLKEIGNENLGQWSNNVQQGNINMVELLFNKVLSELDKKDKIINAMAEVIEDCRQNDCLELDKIDLSEIAGTAKIIEYFSKNV